MTADVVNRILGIRESFQLPEILMDVLLGTQKNQVLDQFMAAGEPLDHDWFTEYFEEEHSNKTKMMQDFTPNCITETVSRLVGQGQHIADICSGTGGLSIALWKYNRNAYFHCEEFSARAIPLLLLNMAIRNVSGEILHTDVLTRKIMKIYKLTKSEKYSDISIAETCEQLKYDIAVLNPPYSQKWQVPNIDERFEKYGYAPSSKADYAFVEHAIWLTNEHARIANILPHGVLFRGHQEEDIRRSLINDNILDAVIGLPDKMFLNTSIPTCILILRKNRERETVLFVDASKTFDKDRKFNVLSSEHIDDILSAYEKNEEIEKYSHKATIDEINRNDYNLNIPRYVDTWEQEELPDIYDVLKDMGDTEKEIAICEKQLMEMLKDMRGTNDKEDKRYKEALSMYERIRKETNEIRNSEG